MGHIKVILYRELRALFCSPIGWAILIIFVLQTGSLLIGALNVRTYSVWSSVEDLLSLTYNILFSQTNGMIRGIAGNLYLYIPLLTMGLFSREFSDGTIKLLFSSPVRTRDIVFGKYLAMMVYALIMTLIVAFFNLILGIWVIENIDIGLLLWSLLMLFLLICTYAAIGLFISSLTSYQFVAALGVVGVLFGLNYASTMSMEGMPQFIIGILTWLRGMSFIYWFKGYVGSWDIIYFILMIIWFVGLTLVRIRSLRESWSWRRLAIKYAGISLIVLTLGYISSQPAFKTFTDTRRAELLDTKILITQEDVPKFRAFFMQILPGMFTLAAVVFLVRRNRN